MPTAGPEDVAGLSLRERKKRLTRQALIQIATERFAQRGFDQVTVAEIADAANVAAKTVFVYFPTKEDLVFHGEAEMQRSLVERIRNRPAGDSPLDAITGLLADLMTTSPRGPVSELERLLRMLDDSASLRSRMRLMWERFEDAIAAELAADTGVPPESPQPRIAAAQLIVIYRTLSTPEVMTYLRSQPKNRQRKAFTGWLTTATEMVGHGIADYARR
ncbi:TetR/AcrR family transcriptional regulator [Kribbella sp. NPDC051587]|uniref:TetR/AcrR family transcriptional regulator n=1 Tax=Kribbella sp. NPDC051587 TaxID=3364119 RepID=UPI003792D3EA